MADDGHWLEALEAASDAQRSAGLWRELRTLDKGGPRAVLADGTKIVQFASNDYLGLSQHPAVIAAAKETLDEQGAGAGASRLVVGSRPQHHELEASLAEWKGAESALVFSSGYAANVGLLTALSKLGPTGIVSDELNHASIVDGARLARATVSVYPHSSVADAEGLVAANAAKGLRSVIVTDSVFSMDGDVAPLHGLADLSARANSVLVIDDAHGTFDDGAVSSAVQRCGAIVVGTLSKSLGAAGGFVAGPRSLIEWLINAARSFVFSTAIPPATAAAAAAALRIVRSPEGDELRTRLRSNVDVLDPANPSAVLPVLIGGAREAVEVSNQLRESGLLVPAIRPPTVPEGTARLRVALSAAHDLADVERLATTLDDLGLAVGQDR